METSLITNDQQLRRYLPNAFNTVATSHHFRVIEQLRHAVVAVLQGNLLPVQSLRDIVDLMRNNEASFPHFRTSATYKFFEPPVFENKKQKIGYCF